MSDMLTRDELEKKKIIVAMGDHIADGLSNMAADDRQTVKQQAERIEQLEKVLRYAGRKMEFNGHRDKGYDCVDGECPHDEIIVGNCIDCHVKYLKESAASMGYK